MWADGIDVGATALRLDPKHVQLPQEVCGALDSTRKVGTLVCVQVNYPLRYNRKPAASG